MKSGVSLSLHLIHFLAPFSRTRTRVARARPLQKESKSVRQKKPITIIAPPPFQRGKGREAGRRRSTYG